jgi:RNA polymerase sigma-70 factor (ECF subfamily)
MVVGEHPGEHGETFAANAVVGEGVEENVVRLGGGETEDAQSCARGDESGDAGGGVGEGIGRGASQDAVAAHAALVERQVEAVERVARDAHDEGVGGEWAHRLGYYRPLPSCEILKHAILPSMSDTSGEISQLLDAWSRGDTEALDQLMPLVSEELHRIAKRLFQGESPNHTLQPTAVVNEVYLKLKGQREVRWRSRTEFFGAAAQKIRRILVDYARRRRADKRGGKVVKVPLDETEVRSEAQGPDLIALDDSLKELAKLDPRGARIVELKIFGGLTFQEIARAEKIGSSTAHRDWDTALLWLRRELSPR